MKKLSSVLPNLVAVVGFGVVFPFSSFTLSLLGVGISGTLILIGVSMYILITKKE